MTDDEKRQRFRVFLADLHRLSGAIKAQAVKWGADPFVWMTPAQKEEADKVTDEFDKWIAKRLEEEKTQ